MMIVIGVSGLTTLSSEMINRARMKGYAALFAYRIFNRPITTYKLLRSLARYMKKSDIIRLLMSPFRRRKLTHKPDVLVKIHGT